VPDAELVHLTVPIACPPERVPVVATVHDVLPLTMPEMFTRRGVRLMRRGLERIRDEAAVVMVPSNMGADEFVRQGFDRSRLAVVHLGVNPVAEPSSSSVEKALARHGLSDPYVLFVGTDEPRKGLDVLAAALGAMDRTDVTLALVGPEGWDSRAHGGSAVALGRLGDRVSRLGFVHDTDLDLLRAGSAVCCLPSRAEGFGLPVLEAMAAGAPVVTTSGTPMEEFAGGVARLVPPGDAGALAEALSEVIDDPETAEGMRGAGRERAARFSWTSSAEAVLEVYRRVLGS
jgi:glycosyltransferase involved in cell wall biosynthesis